MAKYLRAAFAGLGLIAAVAGLGYAGQRIAQAQAAKVMRITFDGGGRLDAYIERFSAHRLAGGRVIIDGLCISACTLVTGLMPTERLCATPFGQLAFHSAYIANMMGPQHSSEGTRIVWHIFPEKLRALLRAREWDGNDKAKNEHPDLIYIAGDELHTIVRPCTAKELR